MLHNASKIGLQPCPPGSNRLNLYEKLTLFLHLAIRPQQAGRAKVYAVRAVAWQRVLCFPYTANRNPAVATNHPSSPANGGYIPTTMRKALLFVMYECTTQTHHEPMATLSTATTLHRSFAKQYGRPFSAPSRPARPTHSRPWPANRCCTNLSCRAGQYGQAWAGHRAEC